MKYDFALYMLLSIESIGLLHMLNTFELTGLFYYYLKQVLLPPALGSLF